MDAVAESEWRLVVEKAFGIMGRGTAVVGTFTGHTGPSPFPAELVVGTTVRRIPEVFVELTYRGRHGAFALMLRGVEPDSVPVGSVLRSPSGG